MTISDEIDYLKKRHAELETIHCQLEEMYDCFEKHEISLESNFDTSGIASALSQIFYSMCKLDDEIDDLKTAQMAEGSEVKS